MPLSVQQVFPGKLAGAIRRETAALLEANAVARLWSKDVSLWPVAEGLKKSAEANLNWLDLPDQMLKRMESISGAAQLIAQEGMENVVFIAMGGSNLAAEAILPLAELRHFKQFIVLDTIAPSVIRSVEKAIDIRRTLFIVANKFGKDIAVHSLLLYFFERLKAAGITAPACQFIAAAQEHSYLAALARQYQFRMIFLDPPEITGRFSSLLHFGNLLAGLFGGDPGEISFRVKAMRDLCTPDAPVERNPALQLAAFLGAGAAECRDRVILLGSQGLEPLTRRIAYLLAGSTAKDGKGIMPVFGEAALATEAFEQKCMAVILQSKNDDDPCLLATLQRLKETQTPVAVCELEGALDLLPELFKWEVSTALTCALLEVDPFHESNIEESRERTSRLLELLTAQRPLHGSSARVREAGIELFSEGVTRQQTSTLSLSDALRTFFEHRVQHGYVAILSFLDRTPANHQALQGIREQLATKLGIPVLLAYGPRYLHWAGELFAGGPPKGLFLILTADTPEDISIPGAAYKFGQLLEALAISEFEGLVQRKKLVLRLHIREEIACGLAKLALVTGQALRNVRCAAG